MIDVMSGNFELFVDNAYVLRKEFRWHYSLTRKFAALLYAREGKQVDCYAIRKCYMLIKRYSGAFSAFRGNMALSLAALLSLSSDPEGLLDNTQRVYRMLRDERLHSSDFLVIAAYEIAAQTDPSRYYEIVNRTRAFFDRMKVNRFFLTGQDDYIYAAMLGLSDLDITLGADRVEKLYRRLKGVFSDRNSTQALSQILVLGGADDNVIDKLLTLRDALRADKNRMDQTYTLPALGILAMLPVNVETIVRDINEVQNSLRTQKGFGRWTLTKQEILIYASAIVAFDYAQDLTDGVVSATIATSISNIIIAQQAAMIAAISASAAASVATS